MIRYAAERERERDRERGGERGRERERERDIDIVTPCDGGRTRHDEAHVESIGYI